MSASGVYWLFGLVLGAMLTVAVGRTFVAEHGHRVIPVLCVIALLLGLLIGWAINGYLAYVRESGARF